MEFAALDLINSDYHDWRGTGQDRDLLRDSSWLATFLSKWDLLPADAPSPSTPEASVLRALTRLRSTLRRLVASLQESGQADVADLAHLD